MTTITQDHIDSVTPATLAAWIKACSAKGIMIDSFNPLLAHVPASQLQSKAEGNDGEYVYSHEFTLDALEVSLDTILRLSTIIMLKHKRVSPTGKDKELHLAAVGLESLELINDDAELDLEGESTSSKRAAFEFAAFGLDAVMFAPATKPGISDNKYVIGNGEYKGCVKVYLLAAYKRDFDDLVDNGLLDESYGRNLVKEGDFAGTYAVLIPCRTSV